MIASLPMYDSQSTGWLYDMLWDDIRDHLRKDGIDAPDKLTRNATPMDDWLNPGLLLSQTCGLPFRAQLHEHLTLVAAPAFWVPDFETPPAGREPARGPVLVAPGQYYSVVVARKDDPRQKFEEFQGATLAYNEPLSQSGWGLMYQLCCETGVQFDRAVQTGAHRASALSVLKSRADLASIDMATWFGPMANDRWRADLKIIARTPHSPALPFVTAQPDLVEPLFAALKSAMGYAYRDGDDLDTLHDGLNIAPDGVVRANLADYMAIPIPPAPPSA